MDLQDRAFITALNVDDVPWSRLTSICGNVPEFPELLEALTDEDQETAEEAAKILAMHLETESILWQPAPWAMIFLARILGLAVENYLNDPNVSDADVIMRVLSLYAPIFNALEGMTDEHPAPLANFSDMLKPEYLQPENSAGSEPKDFYANIPETVFYSYFYYAWVILAESLNNDVKRLQNAQEPEIAEASALFLNAPLFKLLIQLTGHK